MGKKHYGLTLRICSHETINYGYHNEYRNRTERIFKSFVIPTSYYKQNTDLEDTTMSMTFDDLPNVLNAKELSEYLGISISSTYDMMRRADFPTLHINSRLLVTKENFRKWIDSHTNQDVISW